MPFTMLPALMEKLKSFSLSTTNTFIALGIIGIEQIFKVAAYKCPCLTDGGKTHVLGNRIYGLVFLLVPALVLFVLGFALSPATWRLLTGICKRKKKKGEKTFEFLCCSLLTIVMRVCVAPLSWICIALLDGHYYACAMSRVPYSESCGVVYGANSPLPYSVEYNIFVAKSQMIGWFVTAASFVIGWLVFTLFRCCSPFTYLQKEYVDMTRSIEREVFREKVRAKIKEQAETVYDAFLKESEKRKKGEWDDVSRIQIINTSAEITLYSGIQEWANKRGIGNGRNEPGSAEPTRGLENMAMDDPV